MKKYSQEAKKNKEMYFDIKSEQVGDSLKERFMPFVRIAWVKDKKKYGKKWDLEKEKKLVKRLFNAKKEYAPIAFWQSLIDKLERRVFGVKQLDL